MKYLNIRALPKSVFIAVIVLAITLTGSALTYFFLTRNIQSVDAVNSRLSSDISQARRQLDTLAEDREYVLERTVEYERILNSDLLIPHTRRSALRMIQEYGLAVGLTRLDYQFDAVQQSNIGAAARQVANSKYRVNVESVSMDVNAPLDRPIFLFVDELLEDIPGTAVLKTITVRRSDRVTTELLNLVARGENSNLVNANIVLEWRTAQPTDQK